MKKQEKFTDWLRNLKISGKSEREIAKMVAKISEFSGLETNNAVLSALTNKDIKEVKSQKNKKDANNKVRELFKLRTGMSIKEFIDNVQLLYFENSVYRKDKTKRERKQF